jgi:hypothetical protein
MANYDYEKQLSDTLNRCDTEQLNKYLNNKDELDILVKSLDMYQEVDKENDHIKMVNKQIAAATIGKEETINNCREELINAMKELEQARAEYIEVKNKYNLEIGGSQDHSSLQAIATLLQTSSQRAEEDTDKLADDYFTSISGIHTDEELNNFQRQFLDLRTKAHIKKIKAEKIKELIPSYQ